MVSLCRHLQQDSKGVQDRVDTYSKIYRTLTSKDVVFEFPAVLA